MGCQGVDQDIDHTEVAGLAERFCPLPEKMHRLSLLRDTYEGLLPPRQREVLRMKLDEDLSLGEIGEILGISRQACEDAFRRGERAVLRYEDQLGFLRRQAEQAVRIEAVVSSLESMTAEDWSEKRDQALRHLRDREDGGERFCGI